MVLLLAACRPRRAICAPTAVVIAGAVVPVAACVVGVGRGKDSVTNRVEACMGWRDCLLLDQTNKHKVQDNELVIRQQMKVNSVP